MGGDGSDSIVGGEGADTLDGDLGADTLNGDTGSDILNGGGDGDILNGGADNDILNGDLGNDILNGDGGNDILNGGDGSDIFNGGDGNDTLTGGFNSDTLTGGAGADTFIFNASNEGIDSITDFSVADDTILVSAAGFDGGLVAGAPITAAQFHIGALANDDSDRFIYNQSIGALYFDVDGTGSTSQVELARLSGNPSLTTSDIVVF
ncbi:MAG: calcium-binding protein [Scytonema sp. CRU_2_7]|nr:calcium-binding protein [Scytonema sp. CRU_2_7]